MTRSFRLPHPDRPHETTTFLVAPRHLQTTPRYDQQTFYGTRQHYIAIRRLPDVCDATIHALPALRNRQPTTSHEPRLHKLHSTRLRYLAKPDTMRFAIFSFFVALLATLIMAAAPHRSVIISWPKDTPDEIVEQSKEAIRQAKGKMGFLHVCTIAGGTY
ncbi:hypothetical protein IG631_13075 [Alternaria alternata]|nr:hypothetical protein IG631_13075 [Alternaria alternata]